MNWLARKLSAHLISSSPTLRKRLFYPHPITAFQQCNFYSAKTTQKSQQMSKPRTKSSESLWSSSERIKKQTDAQTSVWPKPSRIPYQEKVANLVNLIGCVKIPVRFESDSDGKHFAATVISLGNRDDRNSLLIPVVFEGDLAHVVACHVKENDCIFVSGQLSAGPLGLVLIENLGKLHVAAENLNFVEGIQKSVLNNRIGVPFSGVEIEELVKHGAKNTGDKLNWVDNDVNQLSRVVFNNAKTESSSVDSPAKTSLEAELSPESVTPGHGNVGSSQENDSNRSGESVSKKKDADQIVDLWRDLVKNPLQWWDYRKHKTNGLVKENFPDFKQKGTGESLWMSSAPKWVLPGLGKLEFDVKDFKSKQVQGGERASSGNTQNGKFDDPWKNLVENPNKWWDNRENKRNLKAPDFKHKETGEALWLDNSPVWVMSRLPPLSGGQKTT